MYNLVQNLSFALILSVLPTVYATLYLSPAFLPRKEYDFIVVGAGTAGNVIANRLSEDSSKTVLVIEAGLDDTGILPIKVPALATLNQQTLVDWNFTTIPQPGLNNRSITVPRGFVLGGTSSINFMIWTRGSSELWDQYAETTGDNGWSWDAMEPYWQKVSTLVEPTANPSTPSADDPTLSNGNGPVLVNLPNWPTPLDSKAGNASKLLQETDSRWKYTQDMNAGDSMGFGLNQENAGHGERSSSATAYLHPALDSRSNLDVLILSRATRLLQDTTNNTGDPIFNIIEVGQSRNGPRFKIRAAQEIVLSAGSIGTPHLLLLSGIGPKDELEAKDIDVVVDSPGVGKLASQAQQLGWYLIRYIKGKNLCDHPLLPTYYEVNSTDTFDGVLRDPLVAAGALAQWTLERKGVLSSAPSNVIGFLRVPDDLLEGTTDPASGPSTPHIELIFANGFAPIGNIPQPSSGNYMTLLTAVVSPKSSGQLTLDSATGATFTDPIIDYQLFSNDFDVRAMVQTLKDSETFLSTEPWTENGFIIGPYGDLADATTDEKKIEYIRNNGMTVYHPVGTAKMGKDGDEMAVTDSRLRVKGVKGIRVVDASVFPNLPECHPTAPILALAERAAAMIKEDNGMEA
ncbi:hypothetical protein VKT23_009540 [Stygiomarasmius scandens]|uniref:Glucose-methanol-choline oxidoreductase N-terminal domain-containing protein n=1 Tax=Marasmiellus scandens TaxID=2682957 RepID=A0ABR1JEX2_9AGAR